MTEPVHPSPLVLGIETSCDDTACAVLDGAGRVLASVVSSQLAAHRPYGGVVPEIASREHLANWPPVSREALAQAGVELREVEVVAATRGPGLVGALLVGLSLGKALAWALGRPFHAVHHLEGHLYSPFLRPDGAPAEPPPGCFTGLVLSGGHSSLFAVDDGALATLGETRDDAMGEVFDKVGKRLGLPYPQGPLVDQLAELADPGARELPVPGCGDTLDFSFSGLKSQALLEIERLEARLGPIDLGPSFAADPTAAARSPSSISWPASGPPPWPRCSTVSSGLAGAARLRRSSPPSACSRSPVAPPPTACCAASCPAWAGAARHRAAHGAARLRRRQRRHDRPRGSAPPGPRPVGRPVHRRSRQPNPHLTEDRSP